MSVLYAFYSTESPELSNFSMFNITTATTLTERAVLPEIRRCWFSYKAMRRNCQMQECPKFMFYSGDNTYSYYNGIDDDSNMISCDNE